MAVFQDHVFTFFGFTPAPSQKRFTPNIDPRLSKHIQKKGSDTGLSIRRPNGMKVSKNKTPSENNIGTFLSTP
jgi:hypothetical protein